MNKQKEFEMNIRFRFVLVLALLVVLVGASAGAAAAQSEGFITIGPNTLGAEYGTRYSQQLSASGGTEPYTFSLSGSLPYGITLSSSGLLSGFPIGPDANPGSYSITIQVEDATGATASRAYSFVLDKGTPAVTPDADSALYWHHPFSLAAFVLKDQGDGSFYPLRGTVTFSIDGDSVPGCQAVTLDGGFARCPGVSMDLSIGVHNFEIAYSPAGGDEVNFYPTTESGTLTVQAGSYSINGALIRDNNQNGVYDYGEYTLDKNWTINLDQDCNGTVDYSTTVSHGLYSFSSIPGGQCYRITEVIGEPGWQQTSFPADFWLSSDTNAIHFANYYPMISLSPIELPVGNMGQDYNQALSASGGTSPYTFTISEGVLPAGLTLSAEGVLSGTPTVAGSYSFGIQAEDATHAVGKRVYTLGLRTDGVFTFTSSSNPSAPGEAVTFTVSATGDVVIPTLVDPVPPVGQVTFFADGTPIEGCMDLILNYSTGGFGDYPVTCATAALESGAHQITAAYTDMTGYVNTPTLALTQQVEQPVSYTISGDIYDDNNQNGARDEGEETLYSSGPASLDQGCDGGADYTTRVADGGYAFSGIPGGECYRITIELEEAGWQQTTEAVFPLSGDTTLDIGFYYPDITFSPSPSELPAGNVSAAYYQQFTASGGTGPYIYAIVASSLPEGLTLSEDDGGPILSGTPTAAGYYGFTLGTADKNNAQSLVDYELIIKTDGDFTFTSSSNPSAPGEAVTFTVGAIGDVVLPGRVDPIPIVGSVTFASDGTPIEGCSDLDLNLGYDQNGYFGIGYYPATCTTAALDAGTHTITATYTDYLGIALYNTPSLALVQVVDGTPPQISVTGVTEGAAYPHDNVPSAGCSTTDAESGVAIYASLSLSGGDAPGLGSFTATCSGAVDNAGNVADPVSVQYTVVASADLSLTKTDKKDPVKPGARLEYILTVSNAGPDAAQSITTQDKLGRNTTFFSVSAPSDWTCTYSNGKVICNSDSLASGSSAIIKITVIVDKDAKVGRELVNNASVSSLTYDPDLLNNTIVQKTMVAR